MKPLRDFGEYVGQGIVSKRTPNHNRSQALIKEAQQRKAFLEKITTTFKVSDDTANYVIEQSYDLLIELIWAN